MTDDLNHKGKKWLSEGILISFITVTAYLSAYQFETGYLSHFGIPRDFIEVNISTILLAGIAIIMTLLSIVFFIFFLSHSLPKDNGPIGRIFLRLAPFIVLNIILIFIHGLQWDKIKFTFSITIIWVFFEFVFPLIAQRNEKTYREKLEAQERTEAEFRKGSLVSKSFDKVNRSSALFFLACLLLILLSKDIGEKKALEKVDFLVTQSSPKSVVLRTYGNKLICASYDAKTKEINKSFHVINLSDKHKTSFTYESIGPLHLKENITTK